MHDLISQLRERKREVDFGTTLCSMGMSMNGLMLHLQGAETGGVTGHGYRFRHTGVQKHLCGKCPDTLHLPLLSTGINTFSIVFLPQKVSHEMYRQLYPTIIRDLDVSSQRTTSFHS